MRKALATILEHLGQRESEILIGILSIVDGLKLQPGFDRESFEANMLQRATAFPEDSFTRVLLEVAGGRLREEPLTKTPTLPPG
jgi:hypothetical protein